MKPRSTRVGAEVAEDGRVIVRVHAAVVDGAANRECVERLARAIGVPKSAPRIVRGEKARTKQIVVADLTAREVRDRLSRGRAVG